MSDPEPKTPAEPPVTDPKGPRPPYPVEEPPTPGPNVEPDDFPGKPAGGDLPTM
jgi:hypothetical protein